MKKIVLLVAVLSLFASNVSAGLITGLHGIVKEGSATELPSGYVPDFNLGDFGPDPADTLLSFDGDAWMFGRVVAPNADAFTIVGLPNQTYDFTFAGLFGSNNFEIDVDISGAAVFSGILNKFSKDLVFTGLTGDTEVSITATNQRMQWLADVTNVTSVSEPAAAALMLPALGLMFSRRRKLKAA